MSINISGPVSAYFTKINDTSYIFFGDYHTGIKNLCNMPCKSLNEFEYSNPEGGDKCYEISRLLAEMFSEASRKEEWIDFYLEIPFMKNIVKERYDQTTKNKVGYIFKLYNVFYDCFNKFNCKYNTTRFHYIDVRLNNIVATFPELLNQLKNQYTNIVENTKIYQLNKLYLTSDDIVNDINKLDTDLINILSSELIVNRNGKIMHRSRAQLEGLENDGDKVLANKILNYALKKERKYLKYFLKNEESQNKYYMLQQIMIMDTYVLARMFRNYKRTQKYHNKASKIIIFAGEAHIENYVDFFEENLSAVFSKYGVFKDRDNNNPSNILNWPNSSKCIQVDKEDFNNFLLAKNKEIQNSKNSKNKHKQEMEKYLTGYTDVDRNILLNLDERELLIICSPPVNQYSQKLCDENFWRNRLNKYYPDTVKYKSKGKWRDYFLKIIYYISKLKEDYNFTYSKGDPKIYYNILSGRYADISKTGEAAKIGALDLIEFLLSRGEVTNLNIPLRDAAKGGDLNIIKYLENIGANDWNLGLLGAAWGNNISLIDYFIQKGADDWDLGLVGAAWGNNISLIDYFIQKGATNFNQALKGAAESGNLDVIKHLENTPNINWNDIILEAAEEGQIAIIKYLSTKPNINWRDVYEIGEEIERGDIMQYAKSRL